MLEVGDNIYKKKYFGNTLKTDTTKIYTIQKMISNKENIDVILDNGKIYFLIENGIVYGEKVETSYFCWFCI